MARRQRDHRYRVVVGRGEVIGHRAGGGAAALYHRRLRSYRVEAVVYLLVVPRHGYG